jgi:hypothetical protein
MTARPLGCVLALVAVTAGAGCGDSTPAPAPLGPSLLPADYAQSFTLVRDCRPSIEHLPYILVRTPAALVTRYNQGPFPFEAGSLIVKEEFSDRGCTSLTGYTLMRKEPAGYDPRYGDWHWQRLDAAGKVVTDGKGDQALGNCATCHLATAACKLRDFTCTEP